MRARLLLRFRWTDRDGDLREGVLWAVPSDSRCPEGVRYRLAFIPRGRAGARVLYDNHHPKGHHKHVDGLEWPVEFAGIDRLIADFERDIALWKRHAGPEP